MEQTIMCGIDMHDNSLVCRVAVHNEEPWTKRYGNTRRGRQQLFRELRTCFVNYAPYPADGTEVG